MRKLLFALSALLLTSAPTISFAAVTYQQQATLVSSLTGNAVFGDNYGFSLHAKDDYLFVTAPNTILTPGKDAEGAVYVYRKSNGDWLNTQIIKTDGMSDHFGALQVKKVKNWLFISALGTPIGPIPNDILANQNFSGSIQIYRLDPLSGQFMFVQAIDNSIPGLENLSFIDPIAQNPPNVHEQGAGFGLSFDIDEKRNILLVGAATQANIDRNSNVLINSGQVFSFKYHKGIFTLLESFVNPDGTTANDGFGGIVKINGDYALVSNSALFTEAHTQGQSSVYMYKLENDHWNFVQRIQGDQPIPTSLNSPGVYGGPITISDNFGASVDFSGDWAIIGAPYENLGTSTFKGAAYFFKLQKVAHSDIKQLVFKQKVVSDDPAALITGISVAIDGKLAAVADPLRTGPAGVAQGAALAYHYSNGTWNLEAALYNSAGVSNQLVSSVEVLKNRIFSGTGNAVPSLVLVLFFVPPLDAALPLPVIQPGIVGIFKRTEH